MTATDLPEHRLVIGARPSDRWNPILVKEVRQALRGRTFRFTFIGTLIFALIAAFSNTLQSGLLTGPDEARDYFTGVYFCLVVAVIAVVPFGAFQSMGSEWDESTYDLLSLSNLRPRRIVIGKLQSALVQALLFMSAIVPFLTLGFLMPGVDLIAGGLIIAITLVMCVLMTLFAIALSTLTKQRFLRVVLMIVLGGVTAPMLPMLMQMTVQFLRSPPDLSTFDSKLGFVAALAVALVGAAYTFALACNMIAHFEENRSTNVRLITTLGSVLLLAVLAAVATIVPDVEFITAMTMSGLFVVSVAGLFFVTERRGLGRRVRSHVPRTRLAALVTAPWFPGGGRGVALHVFHVLLVTLVGLCLVVYRRPGVPNPFADGVGAVLLAALVSVVFVTLVPGLFAWLGERPVGRGILRVGTPVLLLLAIVLPGIFGAFVGDPGLQNLRHMANPFYLLERVWSAGGLALGYHAVYGGVAAIALLVNVPRLVASARETLAASEENERRAASTAREVGDARART